MRTDAGTFGYRLLYGRPACRERGQPDGCRHHPGPAVGKALNTLLRAVMEGRLPNEKAALLAALEKEGLL